MMFFPLKHVGYCMLVSAVWLVVSCATTPSNFVAAQGCQTGAYQYGEQIVVLYDHVRDGAPDRTGYTFVDGRRGILGGEDAEVACVSAKLQTPEGGSFSRVEIAEEDTIFQNDGVTLHGRLMTPTAIAGKPRALAVFVHGSESTPTVGRSRFPHLLAAQGITVFAYDKRGTGMSDGTYTQNFPQLADDAAAAFNHAVMMASGQFDRAGYYGGSQGGWVAPLAATQSDADFVVVGFGLVLSPIEEDAEQVYDEMRRNGYGEGDIAKAKEVTSATGLIVASNFSSGIDELHEIKQRYANEPWLLSIEGEFTDEILSASEDELRAGKAGDFEDENVAWRYDAMSVLRSLEIPQLWVIAANDTAAPGDLTRVRLRALQSEGLPITTAVFPRTDHGMVEFDENPDGSRTYTRFTEGFFRMIADMMMQDFDPPYGTAVIVPANAQD
ncbi:S9 family peptidase [Sphingorhabdus sp. EL138]|uniref:alpha/beta hydrolase family protein n=1 Tax=Sphingorhabdus sp. EL138 TaxID=2073156 RepID=UPI000D68A299|nr:alpha/beta hydrolase [Sphingorhabdus sp. EL138]